MLSRLFKRVPRPRLESPNRQRLGFDILEDRLAPATLTVTNLKDSGAGSLRAAIASANATDAADTIVFAPALAGGAINLTSGTLLITKPLTVSAPATGFITLQTNGNTDLAMSVNDFNDAVAINVSLSRLRFVGFSGAAVRSTENLTVSFCRFEGNEALGSGGAIGSTAGRLALFDTAFVGNFSLRSSGGAVSNEGASVLSATRCTFESNLAQGNGGAIASSNGITLVASTFTRNFVRSGFGGAVYVVSGTTSILNARFDRNAAEIGGAAFFGDKSTVEGSAFVRNLARLAGGAIANEGTATIANSTFSDNEATDGGAISNRNRLTVLDSTLSGNSAHSAGGGVFSDGASTTFVRTTVFENSAAIGGGLYVIKTTSIESSTISDNEAIVAGGIYTKYDLTISNSTLSSNEANGDGGALYEDSPSDSVVVRLVNTTVSSNIAHFGMGGGIHQNGNSAFVLVNSTIVLNRGNSGGGIRVIANFNLTNTIVAGNSPEDINGSVTGENNVFGDPNFISSIIDTTLRNNGGATATHALVNNSPAINAGKFPDLITPTGVTSSTSGTDESAAIHMINGSGLSGTPNLANAIAIDHDDGSDPNVVWRTTLSGFNDYFSLFAAPVLTFTMPGLVTLSDMVVWDYTFGGTDGDNARTFRVSFSTDGGGTFDRPVLLEQASNAGGAEILSFGESRTANAVRVEILDNFFGITLTGGNKVGLGEIRFIEASTDQRGVGFPRLVGEAVDIGASERAAPTFTQTFNQPGSLGSHWTTTAGGITVQSNSAQATNPNVSNNIAIIPTLRLADVDLEINQQFFGVSSAGLVARYVDANNYYGVQFLLNVDSLRLFKVVAGVVTDLDVREVFGQRIGLRIVGTTLEVRVDGQFRFQVTDTSLASGAVGMSIGGGGRISDFTANALTTGLATTAAFRSPDFTALSGPWQSQVGRFLTRSRKAQGTSSVNLATIMSARAADVDVRAAITANGINFTGGVVARYSGKGDQSYYLGQITRTSTGFTARIIRSINGVKTTLSTVAVPFSLISADIRLLVTGSRIRFYVNGAPAGAVVDSSLTSGHVGIRGDASTGIDNFDARAVMPVQALSGRTVGAENAAPADEWIRQVGAFKTSGGDLTPTAAAGLNLVTLAGVRLTDAIVSANVNMTAIGQEVGLVAMYSGVGDGSYYAARVVRTASGFSARITKRVGGVVTTLGAPVAVLTSPPSSIRFSFIGGTLTLDVNGATVLTRSDHSLTAGSVGLLAIGTGRISSFNYQPSPFNSTSRFARFFSPVTSQFRVQAGVYSVATGAAVGSAPLNLATFLPRESPSTDTFVAADVAVAAATGRFASLVARYSGTGDAASSMYLATVAWNGSQFVLSLQKRVKGVTATLATTTSSSGTGRLSLTVVGGKLQLFFGDTLRLTAYDFSLKSGVVGMRSSLGSSFDDFATMSAQ